MKLMNIGFGNMISAQRLLAVVSPDAAPIKRLVQEARERGMLIDASTCAGCDACTMACKYQNATPSGMYWCKVLKGEYGEYPNSGQTVLPIA